MHRRWRALLVPAVLAVSVLAAAACGGGSENAADGIASAGSGGAAKNTADKKKSDPQQAGLDFARCMREHGVDMPDPQFGEGGRVMIGPGPDSGGTLSVSGPPAGFEEADKACRHLIEDLIGDGGGPVDPKEQDRALKFAQCMREHGVDMPDPDFTGGGIRIQIGGPGSGGIDPESSTFKDARNGCGAFFGPSDGSGATVTPGRRP